MRAPPALRPGDPIRVIAPSSPFDRERFERGLMRLRARYATRFDEGLFATARYLAGDDDRRLTELTRATSASDERAVFCARGGFGATRLLPRFDARAVAKPLVGFSDITALHGACQSVGIISVHGPVVTQLGDAIDEDVVALFELLENPRYRPTLQGISQVAGPLVEGHVVGGNLAVFSRLIGTPWMPPLDGAILFIEDVGERPYRVDRMWQHLAQTGCFERAAGLALGEWTDCEDPGGAFPFEEVLDGLVRETGLPCVGALPCGHGARNVAFPLGARARLDSEDGRLVFLEGAVE